MTIKTVLEEVAEETFRIDVRIPESRYDFSAYLLPGNEPVLIEPGPGCMVPFILQAMEKLGLQQLSYILPTHIHMDHGGGAGALAEKFPGAMVLVYPKVAKHAIDPSRLTAATRTVYGDDFEGFYGPILPIQPSQLIEAKDGDIIDAGGRELTIIHAPGHAFHHMAIYDGKTGGLFCGEALGLPVPGAEADILPSISVGDLDVGAYLATIEKLRELRPTLLHYPHDAGLGIAENAFQGIYENTVMLRDIILEDLRSSRSIGEIEERVKARLSDPAAATKNSPGIGGIISGFIAYFERKGML
jgi:glyoxylase-like metal-dependent hydrolase (beta-lactamase superfamily II)